MDRYYFICVLNQFVDWMMQSYVDYVLLSPTFEKVFLQVD